MIRKLNIATVNFYIDDLTKDMYKVESDSVNEYFQIKKWTSNGWVAFHHVSGSKKDLSDFFEIFSEQRHFPCLQLGEKRPV